MCSNFYLRKAEEGDSRFVWELANEPKIREVSFCSSEILWEDHQIWFSAKISDENCLFFIVVDDAGEKIGQIRFELKNEEWVISLSIVNAFRGKGLGTKIINSGSTWIFQTISTVEKIHAYIKHGNVASVRVFEKAGYRKVSNASINSNVVLMVLEK